MNEIMAILFGALVIIGTLATVFSPRSFDKLISLGILIGGIMPFLADRGLLDVLAATALITPISTIVILMVCRREPE